MKNRLSLNLSFDFNTAHVDAVMAITCPARVKVREEAILGNRSPHRTAHKRKTAL